MSERAVRLTARAKLNLGLRVLAREDSGYHQLETLFARLEIGDDVLVRVDGQGRHLDCRGADAGSVEQNLAWRAAVAFAERCAWPTAFAIEIDKQIPVGGGLGGGSADAAAVLRALNALAPAPLDESELLDLALRLGADVPFLASGHAAALAWGRGERLLPIRDLETRGVTLLIPPFGIATGEAFGWLARQRGSGGNASATRIHSVQELSDWSRIAEDCTNDLEDVVTARHPQLRNVLQSLRAESHQHVTLAGMTGSGSTLFAVGVDARAPDVPVPENWSALRTSVPG